MDFHDVICQLRRYLLRTPYQSEAKATARKALKHHSRKLFWQKAVSGCIGLAMAIVGSGIVLLLLTYRIWAVSSLAISQVILLATEYARLRLRFHEQEAEFHRNTLERLLEAYRQEFG